MSTHADAIRAVEARVVEAACALRRLAVSDGATAPGPWMIGSSGGTVDRFVAAVDELVRLRAATCAKCNGESGSVYEHLQEWVPCPAGCDHGRDREKGEGA